MLFCPSVKTRENLPQRQRYLWSEQRPVSIFWCSWILLFHRTSWSATVPHCPSPGCVCCHGERRKTDSQLMGTIVKSTNLILYHTDKDVFHSWSVTVVRPWSLLLHYLHLTLPTALQRDMVLFLESTTNDDLLQLLCNSHDLRSFQFPYLLYVALMWAMCNSSNFFPPHLSELSWPGSGGKTLKEQRAYC